MENFREMRNDPDDIVLRKDFEMFGVISKKSDEDFYEIEDHLRNFFNSCKEIGVLVDKNYRILLYNKTAAFFVSSYFNKKVKISDCFLDYCSPELCDFFIQNISMALSGHEVLHKEIKKTYQDGTIIYWSMSFVPAINKYGNIYAVALIADDITVMRKHREKIIDQCSRLRKIAWKESHLLRSPLANLKGLVILLKERPLDTCVLDYLLEELNKLDNIIFEIVEEASDDDI